MTRLVVKHGVRKGIMYAKFVKNWARLVCWLKSYNLEKKVFSSAFTALNIPNM